VCRDSRAEDSHLSWLVDVGLEMDALCDRLRSAGVTARHRLGGVDSVVCSGFRLTWSLAQAIAGAVGPGGAEVLMPNMEMLTSSDVLSCAALRDEESQSGCVLGSVINRVDRAHRVV